MDSGAIAFFTGFTIGIGIVVVLIELSAMCVAELISRKEKDMFTEEIRAGAKLLDEKVPGWLEKINLEELDLCDTCDCVVGQSFPDMPYMYALEELFGEEDEECCLFDKADNYGFSLENYQDYPALTTEWKAYIQERREQDQNGTIEQVP